MNISKTLLLSLAVFGYLLYPHTSTAQNKKYSFSGQGILHYNDQVRSTGNPATAGELDLHLIHFKGGYQFNEQLSVHAKLDIEHLFSGPGEGEVVFLDQAYADYRFNPDFGIRAGLYSVPLGGSIPSFKIEGAPTDLFFSYGWRELAAGVYGSLADKVDYEAYVMSGLHAEEISTTVGIFDARKSRFASSVDNLAAAARLGYRVTPELKLGASALISDLQSKKDFGDRLNGANYKVVEGHADYTNSGFSSRLVAVYSTISGVEKINTEIGSELGSSQFGAILELGYDLLRLREPAGTQQLIAYTSGEVYDTHLTTKGISDSPENERYEYTFGLLYKPFKRVSIASEYQILHSRGNDKIGQLNLGVGYSF